MIDTHEMMLRAHRLVKTYALPSSALEYVEASFSSSYEPQNIDTIQLRHAIDHTNLSFDADKQSIRSLCEEAAEFSFGAVCVNPLWISEVSTLRKSLHAHFKIASVIDFPLGASTYASRHTEAQDALKNGADELDIVISIGLLRSQSYGEVYHLLRATIAPGGYSKIILEMSALPPEDKITAILLAILSGAQMLKTSTGVNGKATVDDVQLLRAFARGTLGVKAAGGIRTKEQALAMMTAGADRIGASASITIISEDQREQEGNLY